ncbi:MAG TPA: AAA family ATPase [Acidimicrobiales bacterium]|nr:AAA family ATPase [Acidimicrobiales bacterium]
MSTPRRLVVVVGTGTEVGKTWVAAAALRALRRRGLRVAARKPVQSFEPGDTGTDADVLGAATGEDAHTVCPPHRWYEVALAPPMAAEVLGRLAFTLSDLVDEITWPDDVEVGLVETAGGVRSPLAADDGDAVALTAALMPDTVVLVADAGLGTLNAVRLTLAALADLLDSRDDLECLVVLNRFDHGDDLHRRNLAWLRDHDGIDALTSADALADALAARI